MYRREVTFTDEEALKWWLFKLLNYAILDWSSDEVIQWFTCEASQSHGQSWLIFIKIGIGGAVQLPSINLFTSFKKVWLTI